MSFSDIISLSSALTSLSMKDGESRRGSIYSAGSERVPLDDSDEQELNEQQGAEGTDSDHETRTSDDDDDAESVDWAQYNMRENQALLSRDDFFEQYIRIEKLEK